MAAFAYDAINSQGLEISGVIHAPDLSAAREQLQMRGLLPQSLAERAAAGERGATSKFKKVKPKSLQVFARQFATMIAAGVSVVQALVTLEEQTDDKYLGEVIADVRSEVEGGVILSRALARHPKVARVLIHSNWPEPSSIAHPVVRVLHDPIYDEPRDFAVSRSDAVTRDV